MVNRYEPCYMDKTMDLEQDGEYVRYEDYKRLEEALLSLVNLRKYKERNGKDLYYTEYRQKYWNKAEELIKESEGLI